QRSIAVHSSTYGDGAVLSSTGDGAVLSTSPNIATATTHRPFLPFLTATAALNRGALLDGRACRRSISTSVVLIERRNRRDWQSEHERWHQLYLGPFDGILSSSLTCQSCSSQISINLEQFDCLPLSPVLSGSTLIFGCALLDCLKQFIVAEHVENYHCHY
ncbi:hypothetical protein S245_071296, partial [Arachis hypogaea]